MYTFFFFLQRALTFKKKKKKKDCCLSHTLTLGFAIYAYLLHFSECKFQNSNQCQIHYTNIMSSNSYLYKSMFSFDTFYKQGNIVSSPFGIHFKQVSMWDRVLCSFNSSSRNTPTIFSLYFTSHQESRPCGFKRRQCFWLHKHLQHNE